LIFFTIALVFRGKDTYFIQITEKKLPKKHNFVEGWDFLMLYFTGENETGYARVSLAGMEWRLFCEPRRQEPLIHQ
jgi:hypothetical protein